METIVINRYRNLRNGSTGTGQPNRWPRPLRAHKFRQGYWRGGMEITDRTIVVTGGTSGIGARRQLPSAESVFMVTKLVTVATPGRAAKWLAWKSS